MLISRTSLFLLNLIILLTLIPVLELGATDESVDEVDWSDSLFLVRNILKDLLKKTEPIEQYKLFIRAESSYKQIGEVISRNEVKELREQLSNAFRQLEPPAEVINGFKLRFTLQRGNAKRYYLSDAVTEQMFIGYLNAERVSAETIRKSISSGSHSLTFRETEPRYSTSNPEQPLRGINFFCANDFTAWASSIGRSEYALPRKFMVSEIDDPTASYWSVTKWKEPDLSRRESWEMFGGVFYNLFLRGKAVGELPEACNPEVELRMITTVSSAKKMYLKRLKAAL